MYDRYTKDEILPPIKSVYREGFPSAPRKADSLCTVDLLHKKRPLHKWDKSESFWLCMLLCAHIPYKHTCVHYTNMPASPHHSSRHNALVPEKYALFLAFFWCSALQHPQTGISAGANQHVLRDSCAPVRLLDSSILRLIWFFQFLLAFAFTVLTCPEKLVFAF